MHAGRLVAALSVAWIAAVGQALFEWREERRLEECIDAFPPRPFRKVQGHVERLGA
jgi:hypothetical protein